MPTLLTKAVTRLAPREQLVVSLTPEGVTIREPRKRFVFGPVSYRLIHLWAAQQIADEQRKATREARAARAALRRAAR